MAIQQRPRERGGPITMEHPSARFGRAVGRLADASRVHVGDGLQFGYGIHLKQRVAGLSPGSLSEAYVEACEALLALGVELGINQDTGARGGAIEETRDPSVPLRSRAGSTPAASTKRTRKTA